MTAELTDKACKARADDRRTFPNIVDPVKVRVRRLELGISESSLGGRLGVAPAAIRRLEHGSSQSDFSVRFLVELCTELASTPAELAASESRLVEPAVPGDDATTLGAILFPHERPVRLDAVACELDWPIGRAIQAGEVLAERLVTVGQRLLWSDDTTVMIVPAVDLTEASIRLQERSVGMEGIDVSSARLVARLVDRLADGEEPQLGNFHLTSMELTWLRRAGVVESPAGGSWKDSTPMRLTDDTLFALGLDEETEARRGSRKASTSTSG